MASRQLRLIEQHQMALRACRLCADMQRPAVVGGPVASPVLLVGQAPGEKEPVLGKPFAWTAGKQLFKWFAPLGLDEAAFRQRVYMAAVCRCFPGKNPAGGDRVPSPREIDNCRPWLDRELALQRPELVIAVGRLAIEQFLTPGPLIQSVGLRHRVTRASRTFDLIPLPHPSGASTWPRTEPGKALTARALALIGQHPAWRSIASSATERERGI